MKVRSASMVHRYPPLLVALLLFACTMHLRAFDVHPPQSGSARKIPMAVALVLDQDLCTFSVSEKRQGNKRIFHVGPAICENAANLFSLAFERTEIVQGVHEAARLKPDAIVHMRIVDASVVSRSGLPVVIDSVLVLEWSMTSPDGRTLYASTLKAAGKDARTFGGSKARLRASMERCLSDLTQQLHEELLISPGLRQISGSIEGG